MIDCIIRDFGGCECGPDECQSPTRDYARIDADYVQAVRARQALYERLAIGATAIAFVTLLMLWALPAAEYQFKIQDQIAQESMRHG